MSRFNSLGRIMSARITTAIIVAIATFLVFLPALQNEFVNRDDDFYIYSNHFIGKFNSAFFKTAFLKFYFANWHPFTWVSHALDYALWGLNPVGHHLTNVILHSANAFLVVLLVYWFFDSLRLRTSRDTSTGTNSFPSEKGLYVAAITTGLLFGLHPLRVESVAWVSERKDVLCGFFSLLSILSYGKYLIVAENRLGDFSFFNKYYLVSLACFVCALLSKPMAVTIPIVLLILDWYPSGRILSLKNFTSALLEKIPFGILAIAVAVITYFAQKAGGTVVEANYIPLSSRLLVSATVPITYLGEMLWPFGLNPFNSYPQHITLSSPYFMSLSLLTIGITAAAIFSLKRWKWFMAAWGYYCVTLLPVIGIVKVGIQATADRYTYLPSIGPTVVAGAALALVFERIDGAAQKRTMIFTTAGVAALALLCGMSLLTEKQIGIWKNSVTLWTCAIENSQRKFQGAHGHEGVFTGLLFRNRGIAYAERGEYEKALEDLDKAIRFYPNNAVLRGDRGFVNLRLGKFPEALEDLDESLRLDPNQPLNYANRGVTYHLLGKAEKALEDFNKAIALSPENFEYYNDRAEVYYDLNLLDKAISDLNICIRLNPADAVAYYNRGHLYLKISEKMRAFADLKKACDMGLEKGCLELKNFSGT